MSRVTKVLQLKQSPRVGIRGLLPAAAVLLIATVPWLAPVNARQAQPAETGQQPGATFRVDIDYVHVDVTVTDRDGGFVRDLGPADFEIYEDGQRQQVSTFAVVDIPIVSRGAAAALGRSEAGAPAPRAEPDVRSNDAESGQRVYVIVLDDLHVDPLRSAQAKAVARQFIERYLGPNDLAAVIHTSGRAEASQEFTTRSTLLLEAVDKFAGRKLRSSVLERLAEYERRRDERNNADLRLYRVIDPLDVQRADQAQRMLKTLANLGDLLSRVRGRRKAVVLISEGVDYPLQQGMTQTSTGLSAFTSTYAPSVLAELRETIRAAARANVSIYAIDPRGLAGTGDQMIEVSSFPENPHLGLTPTAFQDELRQAQDSLRTLSEETGGVASVSSNDFAGAFDRIVRDNSTYYVLGYRSNDTRRDGRFRRIEVRVRRPDVRVRARSGYSASPREGMDTGFLTAEAEPSAVLRSALNAPLPLPALPLRMFAAPFRGDKETSISVGIEIDARNFRFEQKNGLYANKLEVALVAMDAQGKFRTGDRQTVELNLKPDTYNAVQAHGLRLLFRVSLPPGRFQLRAAAHEHGTGASGSVFYDLDVPNFQTPPLSMSGVILTAPSAAQTPTARPDPNFQGVLPSPPTSVRTFHSGETLSALFEVYGGSQANGGSLDLVTSVRDEDGQVRFRIAEQVTDDALSGANGAFGYAMRLPLTDLTPGPYTLRIEARSRAMPDRFVAREVPFEVAPDTATK